MSKKSSLQRTLNILNKLNSGKKFTLTELSYEFDVSERTIRRDLEVLEEEFGDFIQRDEQFFFATKKDLLNNVLVGKDLSILLNILHLFSISSQNFEFPKELKKVYEENQKIYNFINKPFEELKNKDIVYSVEKAVKDRRTIQIEYFNDIKKTSTKMEVKPYKILLLNENFYLFGETDNKYQYSLLRIGLIKEIKILSHNFYHKPELLKFVNQIQTPFAKFISNEKMKEVIVSVPNHIAKYFRMKKYLPSQKILRESESGWLTISYTVTNYREITELIEKWLPHMRINEPEELKTIVKNNLEKKLKYL